MSVTLHLLGIPNVQTTSASQEIPNSKPALLLIYLALANGWVSRAALASIFQVLGDDSSVRGYLRVILNRARNLAWAQTLEVETERLRFGVNTDVQQFLEAVAAEQWAVAYALHQKPLLEGFVIRDAPALEAWLELERERLLRAWNLSGLRHAQNLSKNQNHVEAMNVLEKLLLQDPLQEDVVVAFMHQCAKTGSKREAIRAFERFKTVLGAELELEPMTETLVLLEQIRQSQVIVNAPVTKSQPLAKALLRPPRLIGRESEMAAFQNSNATIQLFVAEPGAGKTRLLEEIAPAQTRWWYCREGLEGVPYQPITQWIRANLHAIPELGAYLEDLARLVPETAPNQTFAAGEPSSAKARLLEALARIFEANPAPIVIDDLQWIDSSSLETLIFIAARGKTQLIAAARHDEITPAIEQILNTWRGQNMIQEIKLEALKPESLQTLIADVTEKNVLKTDVTHWLSEQCGGNVFFALETLRDLIEHGTIDLNDFRIPVQVQQLIERRFKRLSTTTQRVLQAASVIREGFTAKSLAGMIGVSEFAALDALEESERAGFINQNRFQHDLVRQSMYKSLQDTRRKALHARAAIELEPIAQAIIVANHWFEAGNKPRAIEYWVKGAEECEHKFLLQKAVDYYKIAARATEDIQEQQELLLKAFDSALDINAKEEFALILQNIIDTPASEKIYWTALVAQGCAIVIDGQYNEVEAIISKIRNAFPNDEFLSQQIGMRFYSLSQDLAQRQGDLAKAYEISQKILQMFPLTIDEECFFKSSLSIILTGLKRFDESKKVLIEARNLASQMNSTKHHISVAGNWIFLHFMLNDVESAIEYAEFALQRDNENLFTLSEGLRNNLAAAYHKIHRIEEAVKHLEFNAKNAKPTYQAFALVKLAKHYQMSQQESRAIDAIRKSIDIAEQLDDPLVQCSALMVALTFGDVSAVTRARKAVTYTPDHLHLHSYLVPQLEEAERVWATRQLETD